MVLVNNNGNSDPYTNLAIEEFLVRNADCSNTNYLFLYINEPCVVIGKNQSIYNEVNFEYLRNEKLKLCRRISGGGTVYHDKGNLNFAFISKFEEHKINNYKLFNQAIIDTLNKAGVNVISDGRNNMLCGRKKISGSAQFTNRRNIITHGTVLCNADLSLLGKCLQQNGFKIETRAVASVRSEVMNIGEINSACSSANKLKDYLIKELETERVLEFTEFEWQAISKLATEKYRSSEWVYDRSPYTKISKENIEIEIEGGTIISVSNIPDFFPDVRGLKYRFEEIKKTMNNLLNASEITRLLF